MKKTFLGLMASLIFTFSIQAQGIVGNWKLTSMTVGEKPVSMVAPITLTLKTTESVAKAVATASAAVIR